ncbi:MAG: Glu/Leu/Phe/Val dehydrogenase, partial [Bacteroidetes bacterium]
WKDQETDAEGWVVINSLRNGAAGGGTRMRKGLDKQEVLSLAKTMEVKFTVSGPPIGGAKSGINFDPQDPRKHEVLKRWYKAVFPLLKNYYGTGGDLNVDEIHEVIPITEELGLWHPQEGVVNGFFNPRENEKIKKVGQLRIGVSKVLEDPAYTPSIERKFSVADMITGYGVAQSVKHYYTLFREDIKGKKVIVQGWGNVGAAAGYYVAQAGAKIVGIIDKTGGLINENGFSFEEVKQLFLNKKGNTLNANNLIPFEEINEQIWRVQADVFLPCAASRLITRNQIEQLIKNGLQVVSCGANVPFADKEIFFGPIAEYTDNTISLIPDFISNCGMARVFAYLMEDNIEISDEAIFNDTSEIIHKALKKVYERNPEKTKIAQTAFEIALEQLINQ